MNPFVNRLELVDQVVEWCQVVVSHERNQSRDVRMCVYMLYMTIYYFKNFV